MNSTFAQRWRTRASSFRPGAEVIDTTRYEVAPIPDDRTAKAFVCEHHYSGSFPAARVRMGLFLGPRLVGVAVFSQPANDLSLKPLPGGADVNIELGRFVLLDSVPGNGETWFLARCFEHLKREGFEGVVSFSDPMPRSSSDGRSTFRGHVGTIYQAHNGVYLGQARSDWLRLLPDGSVFHNRAASKIRNREKGSSYAIEQLVAYGASRPGPNDDPRIWLEQVLSSLTRRVRHPGNHKYVWAVDKRVRKHLPKSKPYPKLDAVVRAVIE